MCTFYVKNMKVDSTEVATLRTYNLCAETGHHTLLQCIIAQLLSIYRWHTDAWFKRYSV